MHLSLIRCVGCLLALLVLPVSSASAHIYRGMSTQIIIEPTSISVTLRVAHQDMGLIAPEVDRDKSGLISREEFQLGEMKLVREAAQRFLLTNNEERLDYYSGDVKVALTEGFTDKPHELKIDLHYQTTDSLPFGKVRIDPNLFRDVQGLSPITGKPIQGTQKNTVTIIDRGQRVMLQAMGKKTDVYETVVTRPSSSSGTAIADGSATGTATEVAEAGEPAPGPGKGTGTGKLLGYFLWEGMLHILKGWDHIFFVLGLALAARNLISLIKVITAFTLAHSVTLILASLNIIAIGRPEIVEAVVAVSIAYVGLDNLLRVDKEIKWRWAFVFAFGLLHGLTFAGSLREMLAEHLEGGKGIVVACLLVFNFGVELGQLLLLAFLYPTFQYLRKNRPVVSRRVIIAGSLLVLFMGASFFVDRTFLPDTLPWLQPFK